jgi:hypothetical protein
MSRLPLEQMMARWRTVSGAFASAAGGARAATAGASGVAVAAVMADASF